MFKNPSNVVKRIRESLSAQLKQNKLQKKNLSEYEDKNRELKELQTKLILAQQSIDVIKSKTIPLQEHKELNKQLYLEKTKINTVKKELRLKSKEVEEASTKIDHNKIKQLEHALKESGETIQNISEENNLMLKIMLLVAVVVVVSMIMIVSKIYTGTPITHPINKELSYDGNVQPIAARIPQVQPIAARIPQPTLQKTSSTPSERRIPAYKAPFFIGQEIMACGVVVETNNFLIAHI
jgi:hypothetical protein